MRVLKETLLLASQGLGFIAAFVLWYMMFYMFGDLMGSQAYGNLLYIAATLLVMSFFAAKDKIEHEDKMQKLDENI